MRRFLPYAFTTIILLNLIAPTIIYATEIFSENPGISWISLNSNSANISYTIKNASDNSNMEFTSNDNGTIRSQILNINKLGTVGVGLPAPSNVKFQVMTSMTGWAGRFNNNGTDIMLGYANGTGISVNTTSGTTGYLMRLAQNSSRKFEIAHDGKTFIDNTLSAKEIKVRSNVWADYVFEDGYRLMPLTQLQSYVKENKHLPNIPTAKEVEEDGIDVGEMQRLQMEKIEELSLYIMQLNERIEELERRIK